MKKSNKSDTVRKLKINELKKQSKKIKNIKKINKTKHKRKVKILTKKGGNNNNNSYNLDTSSNPGNPVTSSNPGNPGNQGNSVTSNNPDNPGNPGNPDNPGNPGNPSLPPPKPYLPPPIPNRATKPPTSIELQSENNENKLNKNSYIRELHSIKDDNENKLNKNSYIRELHSIKDDNENLSGMGLDELQKLLYETYIDKLKKKGVQENNMKLLFQTNNINMRVLSDVFQKKNYNNSNKQKIINQTIIKQNLIKLRELYEKQKTNPLQNFIFLSEEEEEKVKIRELAKDLNIIISNPNNIEQIKDQFLKINDSLNSVLSLLPKNQETEILTKDNSIDKIYENIRNKLYQLASISNIPINLSISEIKTSELIRLLKKKFRLLNTRNHNNNNILILLSTIKKILEDDKIRKELNETQEQQLQEQQLQQQQQRLQEQQREQLLQEQQQRQQQQKIKSKKNRWYWPSFFRKSKSITPTPIEHRRPTIFVNPLTQHTVTRNPLFLNGSYNDNDNDINI
jgi:hypothetical protein